MNPFNIDFEKLDGGLLHAGSIEVQGAMTVRQVPQAELLEGVHQSSLRISGSLPCE